MLSRLALQSLQKLYLPTIAARVTSTSVSLNVNYAKITNLVSCPELKAKDYCNVKVKDPCGGNSKKPTGGGGGSLPRPVRLEPAKTRYGFLPEEWFMFFHSTTGVTGPYLVGVGLIIYMCSKEIFIMEHEYYGGLSILVIIIGAVKQFGKDIAAFLDKQVDDVAKSYTDNREGNIKALQDSVASEKRSQDSARAEELLMAAKKENIQLQLEAAFRERLMRAYREVKGKLDYQAFKAEVERRINQKHMVQWIISNVLKSITPEQEKQTIDKCIADLEALAGRQKK